MKRSLKIVLLISCSIIGTCILLIFCLGLYNYINNSSRKEYSEEKIIVAIKSDYKAKFQDQLFEISDFNYDNVDRFYYVKWDEKSEIGFIHIYLKKTGKREVNRAIKHFEKLEFVDWCERIAIMYVLQE